MFLEGPLWEKKNYLGVAVDTPDWMSGVCVYLQPKRQIEFK